MPENKSFIRFPKSLDDLRVHTNSWDGPFFRLFACGINSFRETPPSHAMFMDAMEPQGMWEYVLSGSIYYQLGNERYRIDPGQALVSRRPDPGRILRPVKDIPVQAIWVAVMGEPALRMFDFLHLKYGQIQTLPPHCHALQLVRRLVRLVATEPNRSAHFWSVKTFEWMSAWWQCAEENQPLHDKTPLHAIKPSRLISYSPKTIKNFAAEVGYSVAHLSRKLSKQWHQSPGTVLRGVRLEDAAMLLRTTKLNINEIATKIGYSSSSALSRAFVRKFHQSPRVYRQSNR